MQIQPPLTPLTPTEPTNNKTSRDAQGLGQRRGSYENLMYRSYGK